MGRAMAAARLKSRLLMLSSFLGLRPSHTGPYHPGGQTQVTWLFIRTQVAPFWQGEVRHDFAKHWSLGEADEIV